LLPLIVYKVVSIKELTDLSSELLKEKQVLLEKELEIIN